jgi:hypothetical protein
VSPKSIPPDAAPWRRALHRLDRLVTPPAEALVRTNLFADSVAALTRLEAQLRRRLERQTTAYIHLFNLPTASDIRKVRAQLAALEARVRDLTELVEDHKEPD